MGRLGVWMMMCSSIVVIWGGLCLSFVLWICRDDRFCMVI